MDQFSGTGEIAACPVCEAASAGIAYALDHGGACPRCRTAYDVILIVAETKRRQSLLADQLGR